MRRAYIADTITPAIRTRASELNCTDIINGIPPKLANCVQSLPSVVIESSNRPGFILGVYAEPTTLSELDAVQDVEAESPPRPIIDLQQRVAVLESFVLTLAPVGMFIPFGGSSLPSGWLACNGAAISRSDYADLFAVIGTTYGVGNGSTTFNVPDMRGRFPLGKAASGTGSTLGESGGTIDHTHNAHTIANKGIGVGGSANVVTSPSTHGAQNPPYLAAHYIIRY